MEFKGTKGNWVVEDIHSESNGWIDVRKPDGHSITIHGHAIGKKEDYGKPELFTKQIADAKLISAAQDLLETLQGLMKVFKSIADSGDCGWWVAEEQDAYIEAKKAINKALGQ